MAILTILLYPDPRLKEVASAVERFDEPLRELVSNLEETMRAGPSSVGIAAPQVGISKRVAIVDISSKRKVKNHGRLVLVNPQIVEWDGMVIGREGCLSVPDYTGNVIRARQITLSAQNEFGETYQHHVEGFEARAIQHEIDHLDGQLFLDRLVSRSSDLFRRKVYK